MPSKWTKPKKADKPKVEKQNAGKPKGKKEAK